MTYHPNHTPQANDYFNNYEHYASHDDLELRDTIQRATELVSWWIASGLDWTMAPRIQNAINETGEIEIDLDGYMAEELEFCFDQMLGNAQFDDTIASLEYLYLFANTVSGFLSATKILGEM